jgi:hypothetical protein
MTTECAAMSTRHNKYSVDSSLTKMVVQSGQTKMAAGCGSIHVATEEVWHLVLRKEHGLYVSH